MEESDTQRIAVCVECGLPLPLLRPGAPREGRTWVCRYCGCHYHAVLDDQQPDLHENVRPG